MRAALLIGWVLCAPAQAADFRTVIEVPWEDNTRLRQVIMVEGCSGRSAHQRSAAIGPNAILWLEHGYFTFELDRVDYESCQEWESVFDGPVLSCRLSDAMRLPDAYNARKRELLEQGPPPGLAGPAAVDWLYRTLTQEIVEGALGDGLANNRLISGTGDEATAWPLTAVLLFGPAERTRPVIEQFRLLAKEACGSE